LHSQGHLLINLLGIYGYEFFTLAPIALIVGAVFAEVLLILPEGKAFLNFLQLKVLISL
jgi:hypothetical protein